MSEASQFIIEEKAKLESEIKQAILNFEQRTGFHPARVDVPIFENSRVSGRVSYHLGGVKVEIKI